MSHYHVTKRISVLEAMLPSAIKAKYSKAFEVIKGSDISESILKSLIKMVAIYIKMHNKMMI